MKFYIFLAALIGVALSQTTCPAFKEMTQGLNDNKTLCYQRVDEENVNLKVCPDDQRCILEEADKGYCVNANNYTHLYPGEICSQHIECYSGKCDKTCTGQNKGDTCAVDRDCVPGTSCIDGKCTALAAEGSNCGPKIASCPFNLVCNTSSTNPNGTCIKALSLANGEPAFRPKACKSHFVAKIGDNYTCQPGPTYKSKTGLKLYAVEECKTSQDNCTYNFTGTDGQEHTVQRGCVCGATSNNTHFCPIEIGDLPDYLADYAAYVNFTNNTCNIAKPFCNNMNITDAYWKAFVGHEQITRGAIYEENPDYVLQTIHYDYYYAQQQIGNSTSSTSSSSSAYMIIPSMFAGVLALLSFIFA